MTKVMNLGQVWRTGLLQTANPNADTDGHASGATAADTSAVEAAAAQEVIDGIPAVIDFAIAKGVSEIEVGIFNPVELLTYSADGEYKRGEYFPTRNELTGAAGIIHDYCTEQGLRLYVGGDYKLRGFWLPPFEIIILPPKVK